VRWRNEPNPVGEDQVRRLEKQLGVRFPDEYREVLLHHDGQALEPCHFRTAPGRVHALRFISIHDGLLGVLSDDALGQFDFIPDGLVPIALDPVTGGVLFLDFRAHQGKPSVLFLGFEHAEPEFVCASFAELMDSLFDDRA
jgi:hypothetical protein